MELKTRIIGSWQTTLIGLIIGALIGIVEKVDTGTISLDTIIAGAVIGIGMALMKDPKYWKMDK